MSPTPAPRIVGLQDLALFSKTLNLNLLNLLSSSLELQEAITLMSYWIMAAKRISKARFEALTFSTLPFASVVAEDVEWYSDQAENVLGVLCRDRQDDDWGYAVLGRDERSVFRSIETEVSMPDADSARKSLHLRLSFYAVTGEKIFPQGDENLRKNWSSSGELFVRKN